MLIFNCSLLITQCERNLNTLAATTATTGACGAYYKAWRASDMLLLPTNGRVSGVFVCKTQRGKLFLRYVCENTLNLCSADAATSHVHACARSFN